MKLIVLILILSTAMALPSKPTIALPLNNTLLGNDLPDPNFRISQQMDSNFLPVEATLMNVLFFMGLISIQDFDERLGPGVWTAPGYPQVQITSYASTEVRFLLWGIYTAIGSMINDARFHDTNIMLYWGGDNVGKIGVKVKSRLTLSGTAGNMTVSDAGNYTGFLSEDSYFVPLQDALANNVSDNDYVNDFLISWNDSSSNGTVPSVISSSNLTLLDTRMKIDLYQLAGAQLIKRNTMFLTFFTALLHIAQHQILDIVDSFESKYPGGDVWIDMYSADAACLVSLDTAHPTIQSGPHIYYY